MRSRRGRIGGRRLRNLATTAVMVLAVLVAAAAVLLAAASHLSSRGQYSVMGHPVLTVLSGSMTPAIPTGALVVDDPVRGTAATRLHVGDVISFHSVPGSPTVITHRISGITTVGGQMS